MKNTEKVLLGIGLASAAIVGIYVYTQKRDASAFDIYQLQSGDIEPHTQEFAQPSFFPRNDDAQVRLLKRSYSRS